MEIKLAKHAGFCFGVKRALSEVDRLLKKREGPVYSVGDLIHNPLVVKELKQKGLRVVGSLRGIKKGTVVVRAHGFPPSLVSQVKRKGLELVDTTCPFVKKAQTIVRSLDGKGYTLVIVGDKDHPEVKSLVGSVQDDVFVVEGPSKLKGLNLDGIKKVGLLAQTTRSKEDFQAVAFELIKNSSFEIRIFNTICEAVACRQEEAKSLAEEVEVMVVLGGKMSANTKTLAKICREAGALTYHIERPEELEPSWFESKKSIGIVCGTSTPQWLRDEVVKKLKGRGYQMDVGRKRQKP